MAGCLCVSTSRPTFCFEHLCPWLIRRSSAAPWARAEADWLGRIGRPTPGASSSRRSSSRSGARAKAAPRPPRHHPLAASCRLSSVFSSGPVALFLSRALFPLPLPLPLPPLA
eukprot:scaffold1901_cov236-Pinguiococcus_pyrenoidosus.AAC.11